MYNELVPTLELIEKMITNEDNRDSLLRFVGSTFPGLKMTVLSNDIKNCTSCSLYPCNHVSFSGGMGSEIMIIGDAPTDHDEKAGKAFSSPSSTILYNMLQAARDKIDERWKLENIFFTYLVKCKPVNEYGAWRSPDMAEMSICKKFIDREIQLVKPKLIICLGQVAAKTLIYPDFNLMNDHGKLYDDPRGKLMAIYNPSYVMTIGETTPEGIKRKQEMWQDIKIATEYLSNL